MGYGHQPSSVFSVAAILCAVAVVLGFTPMVAVVAVVLATVAFTRGEGLAHMAALAGVFALFAAFFLPSATFLALT